MAITPGRNEVKTALWGDVWCSPLDKQSHGAEGPKTKSVLPLRDRGTLEARLEGHESPERAMVSAWAGDLSEET